MSHKEPISRRDRYSDDDFFVEADDTRAPSSDLGYEELLYESTFKVEADPSAIRQRQDSNSRGQRFRGVDRMQGRNVIAPQGASVIGPRFRPRADQPEAPPRHQAPPSRSYARENRAPASWMERVLPGHTPKPESSTRDAQSTSLHQSQPRIEGQPQAERNRQVQPKISAPNPQSQIDYRATSDRQPSQTERSLRGPRPGADSQGRGRPDGRTRSDWPGGWNVEQPPDGGAVAVDTRERGRSQREELGNRTQSNRGLDRTRSPQERRLGGSPPQRRPPSRLREDPARYSESIDNSIVERTRGIWEIAAVVVGAVIFALLVKAFVIQPFFIPSGSMEKTLLINDRVLVSKVSYKFGDVKRGDVIVFSRPPESNIPEEDKNLIKRVIAIPGDSIEAKNGVVYLNGDILSEPYLQPGTITTDLPETTIPEGTLFVMGDNRGNSSDSRDIGPIDDDLVIGKAVLIAWPLNRISGL